MLYILCAALAAFVPLVVGTPVSSSHVSVSRPSRSHSTATASRASSTASVSYPLPAGMQANATANASYPMPLPCTGEGCTEFTYSIMDFNVIQHANGTYFRFSKAEKRGQGLELATAPTLAGPWTRQAQVLGPGTPLLDGKADTSTLYNQAHLMTPEAHLINGTYYLYYSIGEHGQDLAVASSPTMAEGSWTDHGSVGIPAAPGTGYQRIDCDLLTSVTNGSNVPPSSYPLQLAFGDDHTALFAANMTNATRIRQGVAPVPLIRDQRTRSGNNRTGGAFHFLYNDYVYFLYDIGSCCANDPLDGYSIYVCRASQPGGPYFDRNGLNCDDSDNGSGTLLLTSHSPNKEGKYEVLAPGGVGVIRSPSDGLILTYEYHNATAPSPVPITLFYGHNFLNFDSDGWPFVADSPQTSNSSSE